jgi:anti-sigma B factor antagonist
VTVVPGDGATATLICDYCGRQDSAAEAGNDSDVVWPLITGLGWIGSPFATGTHRCPRCALSVPPDASGRETPRAYGASYDARVHDNVAVIAPLTDLDAALVERLRTDVMAAVVAHPYVVIDLHAVQFIDSAGLGLLVRAHQEARQHDTVLALAAPSRFVRTVLHTMRLDGVFLSFPDERAAFAGIRG